MGFSPTASQDGSDAIRTKYVYAQLHSATAGSDGTQNVCASARKPITWTTTTAQGTFELAAPLAFTGGTPGGTVYSVSIWSASSGGDFGGEFPLAGAVVFNGSGAYTVTALSNAPKVVSAIGLAP